MGVLIVVDVGLFGGWSGAGVIMGGVGVSSLVGGVGVGSLWWVE